MSDLPRRYIFKIKGLAPETIPLGRLLEYYHELCAMTDASDYLCLLDVSAGSHSSGFAVKQTHQSNLNIRLAEIGEGSAPGPALVAQKRINTMLGQDNAEAEFFDQERRNVVFFPGILSDDDNHHGIRYPIVIQDGGILTGELYYISAPSKNATVRINTDEYGAVYCTTTREIAKKLGHLLFEMIRVNGQGRWTRNQEGMWQVKNFSITEYMQVKRENLRDVVDDIRAMKLKWGDDPIGELRKLNEEKN